MNCRSLFACVISFVLNISPPSRIHMDLKRNLTAIFCLTLTLALLAPSAHAADIYESQTMPPQPSQQGDFHPIAIPKWVEDLPTVCYTLSAMPPDLRKQLAEAGAGISEIIFGDAQHVYYDSAYLKDRSPDRP